MSEVVHSGSVLPGSTASSLLHRVKAGNAQAWQRLVDLYGPLVYYWCRRQQLAADDLDDVFQEVFRAVAAHIDSFRKDRPNDTFRGWLLVITQNKIRDHFRRQRKEPSAAGGSSAQRQLAEIPAPLSDSGSSAEEQEYGFLKRALDMIRAESEDRTWQAFWQVVVEQRPATDVAEILGISVNAVYKAKARVLLRLREELGED